MRLFNIIYAFFLGRGVEPKEYAAQSFVTAIQGLVISSIVIKILCIFFDVCYFNDKYTIYLKYFIYITVLLTAIFNLKYYSN